MRQRGRWPRDESAEEVWRDQARPVITLARPRRIRLAAFLIPAALLAVLFGASHALWWQRPSTSGVARDASLPARVTAPGISAPGAPSALPAVFPANGYTVVNLPRAEARPAALTVETSQSEPAPHWVVNLRDWASGGWIATIYLDANSVTTLKVPAGDYQVSVASGAVWEGDTLLFGDGTQAFRYRTAVHLGAGTAARRLLLLPPDGEAAMPVPAFMVRTR